MIRMKDVKALFVIKTRIYDRASNQWQDVMSKQEYNSYPTDEQIFFEMERWNTLATESVYSQVEKIYKLRK